MTNQVNENNNTSTLNLVLCLRGGKKRKGSKKSSKKGSKKGSKSMK